MSHITQADVEAAAITHRVSLRRELFRGGQKAVWLASLGDTDVVLKVLSSAQADPNAIERARREVELLTRVESPHLVRMLSTLEIHPGPPLMASWLEEYVDGVDLADLLGREWSWDETARLMNDVATGLGLAHQHGVIHRDLSPRNVRRRTNGSWVVLDFGFAKHTLLSGITVAGQPGTLGHLSPEHINGVAGGPMPSSDVFCIGILGYLALSEHLPIVGTDGEDYLVALQRCLPVALGELRPDLTDSQLSFIAKCLERQPARRFVNGSELAKRLEEDA